jgi:hypothetical protein
MKKLSIKSAVLIADEVNGFFAWAEDQEDADDYIKTEIGLLHGDEVSDEEEAKSSLSTMDICDVIKGDYLTPEKLCEIFSKQPE